MLFLKETGIFVGALFIVSLTLLAPASADTRKPLLDRPEPVMNQLLERAWAVVYAPGMKRGSLLMLRGAIGHASVTVRDRDSAWCKPRSLRLLLGGFSGNSIGISDGGPVAALVMNQWTAWSMRNGEDIVSDTLKVRDFKPGQLVIPWDADVILVGNVSPDDGFVFNMGSTLIADIFGAGKTNDACRYGSAMEALMTR